MMFDILINYHLFCSCKRTGNNVWQSRHSKNRLIFPVIFGKLLLLIFQQIFFINVVLSVHVNDNGVTVQPDT